MWKIFCNRLKQQEYGGRATYGNPWFFREGKALAIEEKLQVMREHAKLHVDLKGEQAFVQMRKHMGWYVSGYKNASELRGRLVSTSSYEEAKNTIQDFLRGNNQRLD